MQLTSSIAAISNTDRHASMLLMTLETWFVQVPACDCFAVSESELSG